VHPSGLPEGASAPAEGQLRLFGTTVTRAERTAVELVEEPADVEEILQEIRRARKASAAVVLAIHAHEPSNLVDEVPSFIRRVAHQAIDAGADLVVGHGPHRLRGIEVYNKRPILYSLGNFIFQDRAFQPGAADIFENATDTLLAGIAEPVEDSGSVLDFEDDVWWESVIARATFRQGEFVRLELHPIDLGVGQPKAARGIPRFGSPSTAARILGRLKRLSEPLGTAIQIRQGSGSLRPEDKSISETVIAISGERVRAIVENSRLESLPGCSECAFLPYCGADPVYNWATQGDPVGHRPTSEFCRRQTAMFTYLFDRLRRGDDFVRRLFLAWATQ
jgi:Bacterial capsule synthesis protein PGA_cap